MWLQFAGSRTEKMDSCHVFEFIRPNSISFPYFEGGKGWLPQYWSDGGGYGKFTETHPSNLFWSVSGADAFKPDMVWC